MTPRAEGFKLVFGFGALLHPSKVPARQPEWWVCTAPEYQMEFSHRAGYATLIPLAGGRASPDGMQHRSPGVAHGVVYALTPQELDELKRKERGYDLAPISVRPLEGASNEPSPDFIALTFISSPWQRLSSPVTPTRRYADLVASGAAIRGLPEPYLDWLRDEAEQAPASSTTVPAAHYRTRAQAASRLLYASIGAVLVGRPVVSRLWECRRGWEPATSCATFFPNAVTYDDTTRGGA